MTVKLPPLLSPDRIQFIKKTESQKSVYDTLTKLLTKGQCEVQEHDIFDALIAREKLGSTCIGNGVAIPRARLDITNPRAALVILKKGLEINSVDKKPVNFFLAILIPNKSDFDYTNMLSKLNTELSSEDNLSKLTSINNPERLVECFQKLLGEL